MTSGRKSDRNCWPQTDALFSNLILLQFCLRYSNICIGELGATAMDKQVPNLLFGNWQNTCLSTGCPRCLCHDTASSCHDMSMGRGGSALCRLFQPCPWAGQGQICWAAQVRQWGEREGFTWQQAQRQWRLLSRVFHSSIILGDSWKNYIWSKLTIFHPWSPKAYNLKGMAPLNMQPTRTIPEFQRQ